jgi:hypothetical protein
MTDTKRMPILQLRDQDGTLVEVCSYRFTDGIYIDELVLKRDEARKLFFFLSAYLQENEK